VCVSVCMFVCMCTQVSAFYVPELAFVSVFLLYLFWHDYFDVHCF